MTAIMTPARGVGAPSPDEKGYQSQGSMRDVWGVVADEVMVSGPAGCVAGETRIYDPMKGEHIAIRDLCLSGIAPHVQTLYGAVRADVPFRKGTAHLWRITLASGRSVLVTADHLMLTRSGWKYAASLVLGEDLLVSDPAHPLTNWLPAQPASLEDAQRLTQTGEGLTVRYSGRQCRHDRPPLLASGSVRGVFPARGGVLERSHGGWHMGGQAGGSASRTYAGDCVPTYARLSMRDCSPRPGRTEFEGYGDASGSRIPDGAWFQSFEPSLIATNPQAPLFAGARHSADTRRASFDGALGQPYEWLLAPAAQMLRQSERSLKSASVSHTDSGSAHAGQDEDACNPSSVTPNQYYTVQWDTVERIEYERTDEYFDLHVPGVEHYFAEGILHHNTGKSRGILEYLYALTQKYSGCRGLIVRKTRHSLTESGLVTFETHVVPGRPSWVSNQQRRVRQAYQLPNGSEIVVGGLDNTARFMSTEFDWIYVQEAREAEESEWEDLTSRLRNGVLPFQMMIGDTNPDGPTHWIVLRAQAGRMRMIESRHEDNPVLWNAVMGEMTSFGEVYLARLDNLTGVRHKRLRLGLWVGAENMVYDLWDPAVHYIEPIPIRKTWQRFRVIDFGYTHPFACLWGAVDEDGRLYIYRQLLKTQTLVRDHAHAIYDLTGDEDIVATITDHDTEGRDDLDMHLGHSADQCRQAGVNGAMAWTTPAIKDVMPGIERVSQRLKKAGDGSPRLFVFKGSLVDRDPLLVEAKAPASLEEEFPRYVWRKARTHAAGEQLLEEPVKLFDDALDSLRYLVQHLDDPRAALGQVIGSGSQWSGEQSVRRPTRGSGGR